MHVELMLCAEAFNQLVALWSTADDEGRQTLARGLFDEIVYDLDQQQIVDFRLKPWAEQFLIVRAALCQETGTVVPPAGIDPSYAPIATLSLLNGLYRDAQTRSERIQQRNRMILKLYWNGDTISEIARKFRLSPRRVGQVLDESLARQ